MDSLKDPGFCLYLLIFTPARKRTAALARVKDEAGTGPLGGGSCSYSGGIREGAVLAGLRVH